MEIKDALDMMNSDFSLWSKAETKELGGGKVEKTLTLPWGIGEHSIVMEGMTDAGKRRAAVGAYGDYIRTLIRERTDDEAITSRAKTAAGRAELADSNNSDGVDSGVGVREGGGQEEVQEASNEEAEEAYGSDATEPADLRETLASRRATLDDRIESLTRQLAVACRDLRGIDAALGAMEDGEEG